MAENRPLTSIRGIAALWVVGFHLTTDLPSPPPLLPGVFLYGFTGVDLFFVLSGFILLTVHPRLRPADWPRFMVKRVFRLYPLHLFVMAMLACLVLTGRAAGVDVSAGGHYTAASFLPAALLVKWLVPGEGFWNAPSWSIAAEMVCYALLPLWAAHVAGRGRSVQAALCGALAVGACAWLGVVTSLYWPHVGDAMLWWPGVVRALLDFGFGVLLAMLFQTPPAWLVARAGMVEVAACGLFVLAGAAGWSALVPAASGLLIVALACQAGPLAQVLGHPVLHWLGQVSFSLYLLHSPVMSVVAKLPWGRLPVGIVAPLRDALILAIALGASAVTYRWIEVPARAIPARLAAGRRGGMDGTVVAE